MHDSLSQQGFDSTASNLALDSEAQLKVGVKHSLSLWGVLSLTVSLFILNLANSTHAGMPKCYAMPDNALELYYTVPNPGASPLPGAITVPIVATPDSGSFLAGEGGAYRAADGYVYGFDCDNGDDNGPADLWKINPQTGAAQKIVNNILNSSNSASDSSACTDGAVFYNDQSTGNDTFYVIGDQVSASSNKLYAFDPNNSFSAVAGYPKTFYGDRNRLDSIDYDPVTGKFYGANDGTATFYEININTGELTERSSTGSSIDAEAMGYAADNLLYVEDEVGGGVVELYALNPLTGALTTAASFNNGGADVETISCNGGERDDLGDAPSTYGYAVHSIPVFDITVSPIHMGANAGDDDFQTTTFSSNADSDDNDGINDDDGVTINSTSLQSQTLTIGNTVTIDITTNGTNNGYLNAWIDWNNDGDFSDNGEQIASNLVGTTGSAINLNVLTPTDAVMGTTFARFRYSTEQNLSAFDDITGGEEASDGEVEDYQITIAAPTWPTAPVTGSGDGGQCVLTHHTNSGVQADANSFYNISDHTNPSTLTKIGPWNVSSGTVEGLTADVANNDFYALNADRNGKLWLGELDPSTGSFSDITSAGSSTISHSVYGALSIFQSRAIAHQPNTNELWVAAYDAQPSTGPGDTYVYLFKLSKTTGEVLTGIFGGEDYIAIDLAPYTFNSANDRPTVEALTFYKNEANILYGVLSTLNGGTPKVGHLFAVDISQSIPIAVLAPNNLSGVNYSGGAAPVSDFYDIEGMSFDEDGDLVVVSSNVGGANANSLLTVDLTTGIASNKRSIISGDWEGIVCDPPFTSTDYGDAPTDMSTIDASLTATYGDADHTLDGVTHLGAVVDTEASSQSTGLDADGDDADGTNDDDGVTFPLSGGTSVLRIDNNNAITVIASVNGFLNAWVDWNQDGDWDDIGEQIATNTVMTAGSNTLNVTPSTTTIQGKTYSRFRFTSSSVSTPSPLGSLVGGEVEDYVVNLTLPVAVNVCSPSLLNSGFEEAPLPSSYFIKAEDEIEGWSTFPNDVTSGANYFQRNSIEIWKSGFNSVPAYQGSYFAEINAYVDGSIYQDIELSPGTTVGWSFAHRGRSGVDTIQVNMGAPGVPVSQGQFSTDNTAWQVYSGAYTVPAGQTVTRFAFKAVSTASGSSSVGNFIDDIQLPGGCDFGDAPDSYKTKQGSGGAYHISNTLLYMGAEKADSEIAAFGGDDVDDNNNASDDDTEGDTPDDEDGVTSFNTLKTTDTTYSISVTVHNATNSAANLVGWIDFDGNGSFDTDEGATVPVPDTTSGAINLNWNTVPSDITEGNRFVRLRLTRDNSVATGDATTSMPNGMASDGEIEDYPLIIEAGGFSVKGRVYNDSDVDGVNDSNEVGVSNLPIVLMDVTNTLCISTRTDAEGNYQFSSVAAGNYQLYEASRETVPTPQNCGVAYAKDPVGYRSTTDNVLAQFSVVAADVTDKDFADVQDPTFAPDHSGSVLPGDVVFYAHKFTPKSTGTVNFDTSNDLDVTSGWSSIVYQDTDCDGILNGVEGDAPIGSNLATIADTNICLINKVYAPNNSVDGETYRNVISANFDFNGNALAGSSMFAVTDLTKIAAHDGNGSSRLELKKTVENITQSSVETETQNQAKPGDTLKYRIYYSNTGTAVISDLIIKDVVPAFTVINGLPVCETPLPASLTNCTPILSGTDIEWFFPASDQLQGGAGGVVSYEVIVD